MQSSPRRSISTESIILIAILFLAALVRCLQLDRLPPFIDESGHIQYVNDIHPSFFEIGKILGQYIFRPVVNASQNPLYSVRLLVGITGVFTVFGVYCVAKTLTPAAANEPEQPKSFGLLAAALWAFQPWIYFHDRLALHDPFVTAFHVWGLFFAIQAIQQENFRFAALAGIFCGLAAMVKLPMIALTGPCLLIALARLPLEKWIGRWRVVVAVSAFTLPPFLILLPNSQKVLTLFAQFVGGSQPQSSRYQVFVENLGLYFSWLAGYNTVWFILLLGIVLFYALLKPTPLRIALLLCAVLPVLSLCLFMTFFAARYLLPFQIPVVLLMAATIPSLWASLVGNRRTNDASNRRKSAFPNTTTLGRAVQLAPTPIRPHQQPED